MHKVLSFRAYSQWKLRRIDVLTQYEKTDWKIDLKNNGKVVLFGHKISNKNITEGDRNIPMALKILSKKMAPQNLKNKET